MQHLDNMEFLKTLLGDNFKMQHLDNKEILKTSGIVQGITSNPLFTKNVTT